MSQNELPVKIRVHPDLANELKLRKEILEKEKGQPIVGGMPVVSEIAAKELKKIRTGDTKKLIIEIHKIKGLKKNEIISLW